jgi:hypothetical protein
VTFRRTNGRLIVSVSRRTACGTCASRGAGGSDYATSDHAGLQEALGVDATDHKETPRRRVGFEALIFTEPQTPGSRFLL